MKNILLVLVLVAIVIFVWHENEKTKLFVINQLKNIPKPINTTHYITQPTQTIIQTNGVLNDLENDLVTIFQNNLI